MGFPDRIERTIQIDRPPEDVWPALTTAEGLSAWFAPQTTIDLRVGGAATMTWDDDHAPTMRIERVEEPRVFAFTWPFDGRGGVGTYVEFTLEPHEDGTQLTVIETGFAQLPEDEHGPTYDGHVDGWKSELGELVDHLAA